MAVVLFACSEKPKGIDSKIFLEKEVNSFIESNPNWLKDEATQDATTDKFKHAVINWSNEPYFLQDMPLQLKTMRDTLLNKTAFKIATFAGFNDNTRKTGSILNYMQLQVDGIVPPDMVKDLLLNKKYIITGNLYKQGKRADVKYINVADFKGYDLGKYLFSLTSVKPL